MDGHKRKSRSPETKTVLLTETDKEKINRLFEKKFMYENDFQLKQECMASRIEQGKWEINEFMQMKTEMNELKSSLNDKDVIKWHVHTKRTHPARKIVQSAIWNYRAEFCTQAWCKFYEIASNYLEMDTNMPYFSVHLCEAPGAFITSLNHYMCSTGYKGEWRWLGTTLNPYYEGNSVSEMIEDDRFIQHTYNKWYFGVDGTGNLMSRENMEGLKEMLGEIYVNLVTADGSIDCQGEPAEQENIVSWLQHCETITALQILSPGGTFVIKMFTMYECKAICLMYLLNCCFAQVHVFKPCSSKGGNSEVYVICKNYKGRQFYEAYIDQLIPHYFSTVEPQGCLFPRSSIPDSFIEQHKKCVTFFRDSQRSSILRNLDLYNDLGDVERARLDAEQDFCEKCFFEKYKVLPIHRNKKILKHRKEKDFRLSKTSNEKQSWEKNYSKKVKLEGRLTGTLTERKQKEVLPWKQKVMVFETYEAEIGLVKDYACWIMNTKSQLKDTDIVDLEPVMGQRIPTIGSSKFCPGLLVGQVREIIQNVKWLSTNLGHSKDTIAATAAHIRGIIEQCLNKEESSCDATISSCCHDNSKTDNGVTNFEGGQETNADDNKTDNEIKKIEGSQETNLTIADKESYPNPGDASNSSHHHGNTLKDNDVTKVEQSPDAIKRTDTQRFKEKTFPPNSVKSEDNPAQDKESAQPEKSLLESSHHEVGQNSVEADSQMTSRSGNNCDSLILTQVAKELSEDMLSKVHYYSCVSDIVTARYELCDQEKLLQSILRIFQKSSQGDLVVIEMGTCLTRFTVGLVYLLYRSFKKIGFLHHHNNYFHCHLVCVDYQGCPIELQEYLQSLLDLSSSNQSEAVLEIIPIMTLLEDEEFVTFLTSTNTRLLQSFITTVINKERELYSQSETS